VAISINFISIILNSQNTNATVSVGENLQSAWTSHNKKNFGNGFFFGPSASPNNLINIVDNDVVDMPVNDNDSQPAAQNQQL